MTARTKKLLMFLMTEDLKLTKYDQLAHFWKKRPTVLCNIFDDNILQEIKEKRNI